MDLKISVNKKAKLLTKPELVQLTKEELIDKIIQLQTHNLQLKNILHKQTDASKSSPKEKRNFDFCSTFKRHILLRVLYFGWDYQGFASQEDTFSTIEHYLFAALQKTCLIESRESSNYHRCGRTDKGVSAFGQVISIDVRSKFPEQGQMEKENLLQEIDYCTVLNRVLPANIKCVCWMPVRSQVYSARFDCIERTYRYFFPVGNLNIQEMEKGCKYLIGTHDFRNLCKMDVANGVTNFVRTIISANIRSCGFDNEFDKGYKMAYFQITGQSFLWHQIRCIVTILLFIGQKLEEPTVIRDLLTVSTNNCKPQYNLAHGLPLNLYCCKFRNKTIQVSDGHDKNNLEEKCDTTEWIYTVESMSKLIENLQSDWTILNTKSTMMRAVLNDLVEDYNKHFEHKDFSTQVEVLQQGVKQKHYQKLLTRKRCESLENRISHYIRKKRIIANTDENAD